jgi:biotin-[acetyl-CoA-carboxylase] ligase BirA-like protein
MNHHHFSSLPSTQDHAWALVESGEKIPFLITTDEQLKGRGRLQREWSFEPGRSLAMTFVWEAPLHALKALSLVMGLGICRFLQRDDLKIKWPNDLMRGDSKVGGILVESRSLGDRSVVAVGVGLNLKDLKTSSYRGLDQGIDSYTLCLALSQEAQRLEREGFATFRTEFESRLWKLGEVVEFSIRGEREAVIIQGVSEEGFLVTQRGDRLDLQVDGEIIHV